MKSSLTDLVAGALSTPLVAQWLNQPTPGIPRTPDGKPNLSAPTPRTPDGEPDLSGRQFADMDDRGKVPLIASSAIRFAGLYGLGVEFIPGSPGGLVVKHVTGDYRFMRK